MNNTCPCCGLPIHEETENRELFEASCRFEFEIMMIANKGRRSIIIPTTDQWIGLNLIDRDGK